MNRIIGIGETVFDIIFKDNHSQHYFKALLLTLLLAGFGREAIATEQYPDYIMYNGKKYELSVGWGHPSPLQVLYIRTNTQSPFSSYSTANYRGHIATWLIRDGKLYLTEVDARRHTGRTGTYWPDNVRRVDTLTTPGYFGIASLSGHQAEPDGAVLADWFSGVLEIGAPVTNGKKKPKMKGNRFIYVRNGEVVDDQLVQKKDFKRMQTISEKDTSDHKFMNKYYIVILNQFYISYYFQSGMSHDVVVNDEHHGRFESQDFRPQLMSLFDNDPIQFPFSWENFRRNGSPVCTWSITGDSLFVNSISLWSGTGFYEHDEVPVELDEIFRPERIKNGRVFAFWMNGERTIEYGKDRAGEFGMDEFHLERQQRIVLDSGRIVQSKWTPSPFDADTQQVPVNDCDPQHIYRCDHWGARDSHRELPEAASLPYWAEGDSALQAWFDSHPLTDPRAKEMMFRTVLLFKVNCHGEAGEWSIASKGKGTLFEMSNLVLDVAKQLPPNGWVPAKDADGNAVDCWQVIQFNINEGHLKGSVVRKR